LTSPRHDVKDRIDTIESSYEFFLAYAAQGLTTDQGAKAGGQLRDFLDRMEKALTGLADRVAEAVGGQEPVGEWTTMLDTLRADADVTLAAVRLVAAREGVSSQLIDTLNASIHLRALLTDLFFVDDLLED